MFTKSLRLFVMLLAACVVAGAQDKDACTLDQCRIEPPSKLLKKQVDNVSARTVKDYEAAMKQGDEVKAAELLNEIGKVLMVVYEFDFSNDWALKSGWTQKEVDERLPGLVKKADSVRRRLKKIQQSKRRTTAGSPLCLFAIRIL